MKDQNNVEIRTGDVVRIDGAYFKHNNGLFVVTNCPGDPSWSGRDVCYKRICKNGEMSISRDSTGFWPMSYFCSDAKKNRAAREHDKEHATITIVELADKTHIISYFNEKAEDAEKRATYSAQRFGEDAKDATMLREVAAHYRDVVKRLDAQKMPEQEQKKQQKKPAEQNRIKFFHNGIKLDGKKEIIRCFYSIDNSCGFDKCVSISARDYQHLPQDLFVVRNDSDPYTDYFDSDHATLGPDHPLYKYARAAAIKERIKKEPEYIEDLKKRLGNPGSFRYDSKKEEIERRSEKLAAFQKELEALPKGQPTKDEIDAAAEFVRKQRAEEEQRKRKEYEEASRKEEQEKSIVRVSVSPLLTQALENRARKNAEEQEQNREDAELMESLEMAIDMATTEQLEACLYDIDPKDEEQKDIGRFFLQQIYKRDEKRAFETWKKWINQKK